MELVHKSNGGTVEHNYVYSSDWKDQLISYDGKAITYDNIGNPLNYMGKTMTWDYGRRLMSVLDGSNMLNFAYDLNGNRIAKNNIRYYYSADGLLVSEAHSGYDINYIYGANGSLLGFKYRGQTYYYHYSPMGDVMAIYTSPTNVVARYHYGPWGELLYIANGSNADVSSDPTHIANINPIRYRGYYYDTETGFYFLQSRYYDPQTHRFINADSVIPDVGGNVIGYNIYAYCGNNPIKNIDPDGRFFMGVLAGGIVGGLTGALSAAIKGKSIKAGFVTGAVCGAAIGAVCDIVATGGMSAVVGVPLCGLIAGVSDLGNQYWNYKLEKKAAKNKKSVKTKKTDATNNDTSKTQSPETVPSPEEKTTDEVTFAEYIDWNSVARSTVTAMIFAPLSIGGNNLISDAIGPSGTIPYFAEFVANAAIGGDIGMIQFIVDLF